MSLTFSRLRCVCLGNNRNGFGGRRLLALVLLLVLLLLFQVCFAFFLDDRSIDRPTGHGRPACRVGDGPGERVPSRPPGLFLSHRPRRSVWLRLG